MDEDVNPNCAICRGEGEISCFYVDHAKKSVRRDFYYCRACYPDSSGTTGPEADEAEISSAEFYNFLEKKGYAEIDTFC